MLYLVLVVNIVEICKFIMKFNFTLISLFLCSIILYAQEHEHIEKHDHDNHEHHKNEIGIANAPVYFVKEKTFAYGLHIHYIRKINHSKFGIGLGYEKVFDEHEHSTYGLITTYTPVERLIFSLSPGLTFEANESTANFALHFETAYEFEFKNFHLGPVLEIAYDPEDYHISLGLHIGYGF